MRRALSSFVLLLLCATVFHAQKRAFTIEDLYRVKNISDLHLSPDGNTVMFVVSTSDLAHAKKTNRMWTMDTNGGNLRQFILGDKESSPLFSPDGKQILLVSTRDGAANLYLMSQTGRGPWRKLTNLSTGVSDPLWSRDGKWIAFSSDVYPECNGDDGCNKRIRTDGKLAP